MLVDATDNVGVVSVQLQVDGASYGPEDLTPPYSFSVDTTTLANGAYTLTAIARDAAWNSGKAGISISTSNGGSSWFVADDGTANAAGSINDPWDLRTALSHPAGVQPGDTIWLRGGLYVGKYRVALAGTSAEPITVRGYPDERATVDGNVVETLVGDITTLAAVTFDLTADYLQLGDVIQIDSEQIRITAKYGPTTYGGTRAWNGTTAALHVSGAPVLITGAILDVSAPSQYVHFWGFEVTHSSPNRVSVNQERGSGLDLKTPGHRVINMVIQNTGHPGIGFWDGVGDGGEIYGTLIWGTGVYDSSGAWVRGSGIYGQNTAGSRYIDDNISFRNFTAGAKAYATNTAANGFSLTGNVLFDNGGNNFFAGTENQPISRIDLIANCTFLSTWSSQWGVILGYTAPSNGTANVQGNYFVSRNTAFSTKRFSSVVMDGNTIVDESRVVLIEEMGIVGSYAIDNNVYHSDYGSPFGFFGTSGLPVTGGILAWQGLGFDLNGSCGPLSQAQDRVFVRPNKYEPGRGHVIVYNWSLQADVTVDLSSVLQPGDHYVIVDAENYFGPPLVSGIHDGSPVTIPMFSTAISPLVGNVTHFTVAHSDPEFGAFVVIKQ